MVTKKEINYGDNGISLWVPYINSSNIEEKSETADKPRNPYYELSKPANSNNIVLTYVDDDSSISKSFTITTENSFIEGLAGYDTSDYPSAVLYRGTEKDIILYLDEQIFGYTLKHEDLFLYRIFTNRDNKKIITIPQYLYEYGGRNVARYFDIFKYIIDYNNGTLDLTDAPSVTEEEPETVLDLTDLGKCTYSNGTLYFQDQASSSVDEEKRKKIKLITTKKIIKIAKDTFDNSFDTVYLPNEIIEVENNSFKDNTLVFYNGNRIKITNNTCEEWGCKEIKNINGDILSSRGTEDSNE